MALAMALCRACGSGRKSASGHSHLLMALEQIVRPSCLEDQTGWNMLQHYQMVYQRVIIYCSNSLKLPWFNIDLGLYPTLMSKSDIKTSQHRGKKSMGMIVMIPLKANEWKLEIPMARWWKCCTPKVRPEISQDLTILTDGNGNFWKTQMDSKIMWSPWFFPFYDSI